MANCNWTPKRAGACLPELRVIYHAPCHLRAQGNGLPGLELLRRLPGVMVRNADAGCCGISGSYGFKKEKYDIGQEIGAALFKAVRESGAHIALPNAAPAACRFCTAAACPACTP